MYRKQLAIQKIICLLSVVAGVAVFVYSLGIMTDLYDSLYQTMMNPRDLTQTMVPGSATMSMASKKPELAGMVWSRMDIMA